MPILSAVIRFFVFWGLFFLLSCTSERNPGAVPRYNVVWLVAEDISPIVAPYGDSTVRTPNIDRLAAEGIVFSNVFSVSGVCAPSRAALCTGMYPISIGAHHMRTGSRGPRIEALGLIPYECVPPPEVRMVSEILRSEGYYCTNNFKEDNQFMPGLMAWDESSVYAHWRNRPTGKPFYSVFNFNVTHESQIWAPFGQPYDMDHFPPRRGVRWRAQFIGKDKPLYVDSTLQVQVPPYLPDNSVVRDDLRQLYSNVVELDRHLGRVLGQLEEDGLMDSTIIVFFSDHGGPLPREKRLLYDAGLHVPLILRYPDGRRGGTTDDRLISFVDFAPTLLSMCGIEPPGYMQGRAFEGKYAAEMNREYIHAAADRMDDRYDMIRAVRDQRFKYLRNVYPDTPYYLPLGYREAMPTMKELLRLRDAESLTAAQAQWFRESKPEQELFDTKTDPHELNNLSGDTAYAGILLKLREECDRWISDVGDMGEISEMELIEKFWPNRKQPLTATPKARRINGKLSIKCETAGASIGYKFQNDTFPGQGWHIYSQPVEIEKTSPIRVVAHRLGYAISDTVIVE